jgi:diguanylate cyclase (GGDEF)-like protein
MPSGHQKILYTASGFLFLLAIVSADVIIGSRFSVTLFYLVPIAWCAWLAGRAPSMAIAVFAACCRFGNEVVQEINDHTPRPELIWNVSTELVFFLIFTVLLLKTHQLLEEERNLARMDALTRLLNARSFKEMVGAERERLRRYGRTLSLVYLDLDNFKSVNDRLGHHVGDQLLKTIADCLRANTRQVDVAARLGGDEFAVLLPETDEYGAATVLHRLQSRILEAMQAQNWPVTCSIGCVTFHEPPESMEEMLQQADAVMYRSKHGGKNRIEMEVWG